jgi:DNA-binding XRE family transcriptional regulator
VSRSVLTEYVHPEAPEDFRPDRRCQMPLSECKTAQQLFRQGQEPERGKLHRYSKKMGSETKGPQGLLLCNLCARAYLDDDLAKAIEREAKRLQDRQVFFLPKLKEARRIYGERKGQGVLSQKALARMAGTNDTTISHIENGERGATKAMSHDLARALGVSVNELRGKGC